MDNTRYNGWTNYETWNINLWLDNDAGSHEYWRERAIEAYTNADTNKVFSKAENAALDLRHELADYFNEINPLADEANCFSDLLGAALSSVNWYEIAEHWITLAEESQAA